jgi:hypothetical protein
MFWQKNSFFSLKYIQYSCVKKRLFLRKHRSLSLRKRPSGQALTTLRSEILNDAEKDEKMKTCALLLCHDIQWHQLNIRRGERFAICFGRNGLPSLAVPTHQARAGRVFIGFNCDGALNFGAGGT